MRAASISSLGKTQQGLPHQKYAERPGQPRQDHGPVGVNQLHAGKLDI